MIQYLRIEIISFQSCNYDMAGLFKIPQPFARKAASVVYWLVDSMRYLFTQERTGKGRFLVATEEVFNGKV